MTVRVPHLALPFRVVDGTVAVNEQDSLDDITACAEAILRCPQGFRLEQTQFGTPDQLFAQGGADPAVVAAAVARWEPRATVLADADRSLLDQFISQINVQVEPAKEPS